jgi:glycosyltransferase involved in cell wall biosynthesis
MKVVIQIPCYNEESTLAVTLSELPRRLPGIRSVEWLVIDDGSTDRTVEVARENGVDHIVRLPQNRGLAAAFMTGVKACLACGADIIVNTDADNQYCGADIAKLIAPIVNRRAEIVVGARPIHSIKHFSRLKKLLQNLGSGIVRMVSGVDIPDAPSGFRAISREAALRIDTFSRYTYTLEMIIQAGHKGIPVVAVPVRVNRDLRPSRLVKSIRKYVTQSAATIVRIFALYQPFRFFMAIGAIPFSAGVLLMLRWVYLYFFDYPLSGKTHVPSLITAAVLLGFGMQIWVLAFVADLMRANRLLLEDATYYIRKQAMDGGLHEHELKRLLEHQAPGIRAG